MIPVEYPTASQWPSGLGAMHRIKPGNHTWSADVSLQYITYRKTFQFHNLYNFYLTVQLVPTVTS